jgi:putative transposase
MRLWVPLPVRDEVVDFVRHYSDRTGLAVSRLLGWIGLARDRFYDWRDRYGQANRHNAPIPRDFWIEEWERRAIIDYYSDHCREGYRRVTYMMLDADIVAVSPSTTYRVLKRAGLLRPWLREASKKGTGFVQPLRPHEHWHTDVSYLNIAGTFYYFCGLLDGFSRFVVHWEIRESMTVTDVQILIQRAREAYPQARPRIISDNGPQFIARDLKEFLRLSGMTHVRTSPFYPQSNGKIERFHKSLKHECIRPSTPVNLDDARRTVARYVQAYNCERLHSAIGYITPRDKLEGRAPAIFDERRRKLRQAHERRKASQNSQRTRATVEASQALTAPT